MFRFVNRRQEEAVLDELVRTRGLLVLHGRRRLGKTRLVTRWLQSHPGLYTQAIEGSPELQLEQIFRDLAPSLTTKLAPRTWEELFEILDLQGSGLLLVIDEFPYLVATDVTLPSRLQKWLDHRPDRTLALILMGSSTRAMSEVFLEEGSPLFGRARRTMRIDPMTYGDFCRALGLPTGDPESFLKYSLVGGVPRYWEFVRPDLSPVDLADELFFGFAPYMENEPRRVLRDEKVEGLSPVSLLEAIGRGAERPSEIAARLGAVQTSLSPVLAKLVSAAILVREIPFGESERNAKRTLYKLVDPSLRFWFRVYSPHRTLWRTYGRRARLELLQTHAGTVFEDFVRQAHPGAARYWEKGVEIDMIRPDTGESAGRSRVLVVSEIKHRKLSARDRASTLHDLETRWLGSQLARSHSRVRFEVVDTSALERLSAG